MRQQVFGIPSVKHSLQGRILQECCRIAALIWQLKVIAYVGAIRKAKSLLPRLKTSLLQLDDDDLQTEPEAKLVFWIQRLSAMTAEYTAERDWFLGEVVQSATTLNIKLEKQEVWRILEDFLLISSEAGLHGPCYKRLEWSATVAQTSRGRLLYHRPTSPIVRLSGEANRNYFILAYTFLQGCNFLRS